MEKNNAYFETLAKVANLLGRTKESIQVSSSDASTSITMFTADNKKIIGNWYLAPSDSKELLEATFEGLRVLVEKLEKCNDEQAA